MSKEAYIGSMKRDFTAAFIHEMEENYGFLKSQQMLKLLAQDIQKLIEQFYPKSEHLQPGMILFTGTKADGSKIVPGQGVCDLQSVTIPWPLITADDLEWRATKPDTKEERYKLTMRRVIRMIEHGQTHPEGPVLLTVADLAHLFTMTSVSISLLLKDARQQTGKPLHTKGYHFDQGMRPTHKAEIVELYEKGHDEADIARLSQHSQTSVGHYLRDYFRVKELCKIPTISLSDFPRLLDMQPSVVGAYVELLRTYHSHLFDSAQLESSVR